jgi:hypothetical protein
MDAMKSILDLRFAAVIGAGLSFTLSATANPINVTSLDLPTCDVLSVPGTTVDELGLAPNFPADERISSTAGTTPTVACPSNALPLATNALVSITNLTPYSFTDLWYAADVGTSFTNIDGQINGPSALGFKIDRVGINQPLLLSAASADGIFAPGETWQFIIDGYSNSNSLAASAFVGLGVPSPVGSSSGSIIAAPLPVPEPASAALLGLGLLGLARARRRPL